MSNNLPAPAQTAVRAIAGGLVRHILTMAGMALVSHGIVDQSQVDAMINPLVEEVVGAAIIMVSTGWSSFASHMSHTRFANTWHALFDEQQKNQPTS